MFDRSSVTAILGDPLDEMLQTLVFTSATSRSCSSAFPLLSVGTLLRGGSFLRRPLRTSMIRRRKPSYLSSEIQPGENDLGGGVNQAAVAGRGGKIPEG